VSPAPKKLQQKQSNTKSVRTTHETFDYSNSTRLGLAAVSGLLLTISFPLFHLYLAAWIAIAVLMAASAGAKLKIAALCGFLHGIFFFGPTLTWLDTVFQAHGGVAPFAAACVFALIVAVASLFTAAFALAFAFIARRSLALACAAAPFLYILQEFAKGRLPGVGFPWNLIGYTAAHSLALLQLAPIGGVWLLGLLVVCFNALLFYGIAKLRTHRSLEFDAACVVALALVLTSVFGPHWVPQQWPDHISRLVQTNFPLEDAYSGDWMQQNSATLANLATLSVDRTETGTPATWVIWPEVPAPFSMQDPRFAGFARQIAEKTSEGFLVGEVDWKLNSSKQWRAYNSAAELDPQGRETFLYDKIHLVPFAEHVPFSEWFGFVRHITIEVGNFEPGTQYKVGALPDGHRFGVFICYEAIFPDEVRRFARNGAEVLVTVSDDGWFGRSAAPAQHVDMARVRAVENRRWLLRSTNNGYTVDVDPYGRIVAQLPTDVRAQLTARYAYRDDETLYTRYGEWVPWLSLIVTIFTLIFAATKAKPNTNASTTTK
jgi:apolipoprotein N-acyltransferase